MKTSVFVHIIERLMSLVRKCSTQLHNSVWKTRWNSSYVAISSWYSGESPRNVATNILGCASVPGLDLMYLNNCYTCYGLVWNTPLLARNYACPKDVTCLWICWSSQLPIPWSTYCSCMMRKVNVCIEYDTTLFSFNYIRTLPHIMYIKFLLVFLKRN